MENEDIALQAVLNKPCEMPAYLTQLNASQQEAVVHTGGPLLILAGAGSGKTRVITNKIAYLIQTQGVNPYNILAVTFTKKAATEMKERAISLESSASSSQICTFHSFGAWLLRLFHEEVGIDANFIVYDDDDSASLVQKANEDLTKIQANIYAHKISLAKDYCLTPNDDLSIIDNDSRFPFIYARYQERLVKTGNVDYGDLIMLPQKILAQNDKVRNYIHNRFRVVMVDEYQDTNMAQFMFLQQLYDAKNVYMCVVGDDDQSIYKFRGAKIENILTFQDKFRGTTLIKLEKNYRCIPEILIQANSIISHNEGRLGKVLQATRESGKKPALIFLPDVDKECAFCTQLIKNARKEGVPYSSWAITYRTNAQSLGFETIFSRNSVPYHIVGSLRFFDREEVKDILAFLSVVANPHDEIAFRRIVNKPSRGVGVNTQDIIVNLSYVTDSSQTQSLIYVCENIAKLGHVSKKATRALEAFAAFINNLCDIIKMSGKDVSFTGELALQANDAPQNVTGQLSVLLDYIAKKSGLKEYYEAQDEIQGSNRVDNIEMLTNTAASYPLSIQGLTEFLDHINLEKNLTQQETDNIDSVTLITLHNTKGLEFSRVIITGMENGIFPREGKNPEEIEEERRLLYVGITRAKDELYFTSCAVRRLYGGQPSFMLPSMFLSELDKDNLRILGDMPANFNFRTNTQWQVGLKVYHDDYGMGFIQQVYNDKNTNECVVLVKFETGTVLKFLPEYQKNKLFIVKDSI